MFEFLSYKTKRKKVLNKLKEIMKDTTVKYKITVKNNDGIVFYDISFPNCLDKSIIDIDSIFKSLNEFSDSSDSVTSGKEYLIFGIIQKNTEVL